MNPGLLVLLTLASGLAAGEPVVHEYQSPHMGCLFTFKIVDENEQHASMAARAGFARVRALDAAFSDYQPNSELSQLTATAGKDKFVPMSEDLHRIMADSARLWKWSDGTFDITLGACTQLWRASRKSHALPNPEQIAAARETAGFEKLQFSTDGRSVKLTQSGTVLDLGGIAKGFALDEVTTLLKAEFHLTNFMLDAGGQIAAIGHPPGREAWGLAIEKLPNESADSPTPTLILKLKDQHLATSGDLHQSVLIDGKHYAHIIDPETGLGLTYTVQASVIADDGTTADAVATALCLLPEAIATRKLKTLPKVQARVLRQTEGQPLTTWQTPGWPK
jgi:thiamine biosynthesis lipoprotein